MLCTWILKSKKEGQASKINISMFLVFSGIASVIGILAGKLSKTYTKSKRKNLLALVLFVDWAVGLLYPVAMRLVVGCTMHSVPGGIS